MKEMINRLRRRMKTPAYWVEASDAGFTAYTHRGWFKPAARSAAWSDVTQIYAFMQDCFIGHTLGLQLQLGPDRHLAVDEEYAGWKDFLSTVFTHFPDFDRGKLKEVESFFPGEGWLQCWGEPQEIANKTPEHISKGRGRPSENAQR